MTWFVLRSAQFCEFQKKLSQTQNAGEHRSMDVIKYMQSIFYSLSGPGLRFFKLVTLNAVPSIIDSWSLDHPYTNAGPLTLLD